MTSRDSALAALGIDGAQGYGVIVFRYSPLPSSSSLKKGGAIPWRGRRGEYSNELRLADTFPNEKA